MVTPDSLVEQFGETVTLTRVSSFDAGRDGVTNVTREFTDVKAVISQPDESDEQRLAGRLESGAITATVPTDTDVQSDRDGGRDRLIRPAVSDPENPPDDVRLYTVEEVADDTHPMVGIDKLTLMCSEFGGREDLANDADSYTSA